MAKKEQPPLPDGQAPAKGKLKLIIIIVLAFLLAVGASVGGTWFFLHKSAKPEEAEAKSAEHAGRPRSRRSTRFSRQPSWSTSIRTVASVTCRWPSP